MSEERIPIDTVLRKILLCVSGETLSANTAEHELEGESFKPLRVRNHFSGD
jgi:hypothetical protein